MTEKLTRIRVPSCKNSLTGYQDWGELDRPAMVKTLRGFADHMREAVAQIDATADSDFEVDVVRGCIVQRHVRKVP